MMNTRDIHSLPIIPTFKPSVVDPRDVPIAIFNINCSFTPPFVGNLAEDEPPKKAQQHHLHFVPSPDEWRLFTHCIIGGEISTYAFLDNGANINVMSPALAKHFSTTNPARPFECSTDVFGGGTVTVTEAIDISILHAGKVHILTFAIYQLPSNIPLLIGNVDQPRLGIQTIGLQAGPSLENQNSNDDPFEEISSSLDPSSLGDVFYPDAVRHPILAAIQPSLDQNALCSESLPCSYPNSVVRLATNEEAEFWRRQYPVPRQLRESFDQHFVDLLAKGFIEPAPIGCRYNLPHCGAPKKHPITREKIDTRWCLDPRALNAFLPPTPNILPRMSELFSAMQSSSIFSAIDLKHAYLQFDLLPEDRPKTAFTATINGETRQWMYKRAIWGIRHLSHHVQSIMRAMFTDMPFVTVYIDDLIVHSSNPETHADHLAAVIQRLTKYNLIINVEKTNVGMSRFRAFGHIASGETLCADPSKVAAVMAWPVPKSGTDVESFLGFVNWLRDFVPNYAAIAAPLEAVRKFKSMNGVWGEHQTKSFNAFKDLIRAQVQLFKPVDDVVQQVATDASNYAVGAVLYQIINGKYHFIAFHSKALNKSQRNYSATKRELFGIVSAFRAFREFLYGTYFQLFTDHKALIFLHTQRHLNPMLLTWFEELLEMDFEIFHRPGLDNILPDALSRIYLPFTAADFKLDALPPLNSPAPFTSSNSSRRSAFPLEALIKPPVQSADSNELDQEEDKELLDLLALPTAELTTKPFLKLKAYIKDRLNKTLPSPEEQISLLDLEHAQGHFGASCIVSAILEKGFWWPSCTHDAEKLVGNCRMCQRFNVVREGFHPLRSIAITSRFNHWAIDLATDLPESPDGFKHILIILIRGSEFRLLVPLKNKENVTVATALWSIMSIFGPPAILQSDRGSEFVDLTVKALSEVFGVERRLIAQYNPRANGAVEKCVGTTKKVLVKLCNGANHNWPLFLPTIQFFFNRKINPTTGSAPFSLMFGRTITGFEDFRDFVPDQLSPSEFSDFVEALFKELDNFVFPAVSSRASNQHSKTAERVNEKRTLFSKPLPLGTVVNVTADPNERKIFGAQQSSGPYMITGVTKNLLYFLVDRSGRAFPRPVPVSQLKILPLSQSDFNNLSPSSEEVLDSEESYVTKVLDMKDVDGETYYLLKFRGVPIPEWTPNSMCQCPAKIRSFRRLRGIQGLSTTPVWPSPAETLSLASLVKPNHVVAVRDIDALSLDGRYLIGTVLAINNNIMQLHYHSVDTGKSNRLRPISEAKAVFRKTYIDQRDQRPSFNYRKPDQCPEHCTPWTGEEDIANLIAIDLEFDKQLLSKKSAITLSKFLPTTLQEISSRQPQPLVQRRNKSCK